MSIKSRRMRSVTDTKESQYFWVWRPSSEPKQKNILPLKRAAIYNLLIYTYQYVTHFKDENNFVNISARIASKKTLNIYIQQINGFIHPQQPQLSLLTPFPPRPLFTQSLPLTLSQSCPAPEVTAATTTRTTSSKVVALHPRSSAPPEEDPPLAWATTLEATTARTTTGRATLRRGGGKANRRSLERSVPYPPSRWDAADGVVCCFWFKCKR